MQRLACRDVTEPLHKRADGRLPAGEAAALDEHLRACTGCRARAEQLDWAATALQRRRDVPRGFADRVLHRVAEREGATRPVRPRPLTLGIAWLALPVAALILVAAGLALRGVPNAPPPPSTASRAVEPPRVQVELELAKASARTVSVAGDFNEWQADGSRLTKGRDGVWRIRLELPPGRYQYVFVIDGEQWIADPQASTVVDSGFSGTNSVLDVSL